MTLMQFKKVFRGYDPVQVVRFINETADRETATRMAQRERIEELSEENRNLRDRIVELQRRQNDVAEVMIVAQQVANEIEQSAMTYADRALLEAKKFYATWQAYSKTIVASFTEDELVSFNNLERKIGEVIANYEHKLNTASKPDEAAAGIPQRAARKRKMTPDEFVKRMEQAAENLGEKSDKAEQEEQQANADKSVNPISRVEQAAGQSIDIRELARPEQTLEELCLDLGLITSDDEE